MSAVDRTDEFRKILLQLSAQPGAPGIESREGPVPQAQSELNVWSAEIGSGIHQASMEVQELRRMARKKGIFEDRTCEIQEITYGVKRGIQSLNQKIEALQLRAKGTGPNRNYQAHSANVVEALKTRLLEVTKDFKDALEDRSKVLEQQDKRRNLYSAGQGVATNPFAQKSRPSPAGNPDDLEGGGSQATALQTGYQSSRVEAVQSVQRTIGELAQMFQKMAVMVTAQEEMIQRIDHDVDDTLSNVNAAQDDLFKYFHHISSNRGLTVKVFLILIFFIIFFVVFLA